MFEKTATDKHSLLLWSFSWSSLENCNW